MKNSRSKTSVRKLPKRPQIYLAAPLFSPAERQLNAQLCTILEQAGTVYLPQRDGGLVESLRATGSHEDSSAGNQVFTQDMKAIDRANVIVAVLDGRALDEGVCIEMGYGKARGALIVGFKSDVRTALPWGQNPMVNGCVDLWVRSDEELIHWAKGISERVESRD